MRAWLRDALRHRSGHAYTVPKAPAAGLLVITWSREGQRLARGAVSVAARGRRHVALRVSPRLKGRVIVSARARFTPTDGLAVAATRRVAIRR